MKNYKDMADAVFRRRDEYAAVLKRKKKIAFNVSLSLCTICLAVLGAFGIWKIGVLEPDPNVIGTKPQSLIEPTEESKHILSSNATSEGANSINTEIVSNSKNPEATKPISETVSKPQRGTEATDPVEKPTKPVVKPSSPNLPQLPQLPDLPNSPQLPTLPIVTPTKPLATDPVEVPDATSATSNIGNNFGSNQDVPPTSGNKPTKPPYSALDTSPVPPETVSPTWAPQDSPETEGPGFAVPDEAPGWWEEPTMPGISDETEPTVAATMPNTETPAESLPCAPPTEPIAGNMVEGKVVDQHGNPVSGAVVRVYSQGMLVRSYTTGPTGYYYMSGFRDLGDNYVKVYSVPNGYQTPASNTNISGYYSYVVFVCTKK